MPGFIQVKKWIREAAVDLGAYVSEMEAKALAGAYLTTQDRDHELRVSSLTYSDTTGEAAVKAWFRAVAA